MNGEIYVSFMENESQKDRCSGRMYVSVIILLVKIFLSMYTDKYKRFQRSTILLFKINPRQMKFQYFFIDSNFDKLNT